MRTLIDKLLRKQQAGPFKKRKEKAVIILYLILVWTFLSFALLFTQTADM
jgi:hypothetical protein